MFDDFEPTHAGCYDRDKISGPVPKLFTAEFGSNMKTTLRISLMLNLAFLAGTILFLSKRNESEVAPSKASSQAGPASQKITMATPPASESPTQPFRWSQLESSQNYQAYIANLRVIGCPETTVEDIVRGDTERAFSWERSQLGLDGSGSGPWSRAQETRLIADLLGEQQRSGTSTRRQDTQNSNRAIKRDGEVAQISTPSSSTETVAPSYPLFLQNADWTALGFTADQQAAIARVRQQFQSAMAIPNQVSDGSRADDAISNAGTGTSAPIRWQKAIQLADQQLRDALGAQGYMAYEQQQYYEWYQPQVVTAAASGNSLAINPDASTVR